MALPKIIIADDSRLSSHILRSYIEKLGYTLCGEAANGIEAIDLARKIEPNIAILDVYMPKMDGYQACKIIQDKLHIPVILITGRADDSSVENMVNSAPSGVLIKPFNLYQFKSTVDLIYSTEKSQVNLARYKNIVPKAPMLFFLIDNNYRYILANDMYCKTFGLNESQIVGLTIAEVFGSETFNSNIKHNFDRALSGSEVKYESWFNFKIIGKKYMSVTYSPYSEKKGGVNTGVVVLSSDITQLKLSEEKLQILSSTDQLTGTNNRRRLLEVLSSEIDRAQRFMHPLSSLSLDIDNFKAVNDTYGHPVGDEALIYTTGLIKTIFRNVDTIGRLGGEEFGVIIPEVDKENLKSILQRAISTFNSSTFKSKDINLLITVSIGSSTLNSDAKTMEEILSNADKAMYESKRNGKNRYTIYDEQPLKSTALNR